MRDTNADSFLSTWSPQSSCTQLGRLATTGAIVGGSATAAGAVRRVRAGEQSINQALAETGKAAVTAGVATAVGGLLAESVARDGLLRLGVMFLAGAAVVYGIQERMGAGEDA